MYKLFTERKYNSRILCASSLVYLLAGFITIERDFYLSTLLFVVTFFSILYHNNFKNFSFKTLDWIFGIILLLYVLYLLTTRFDFYIFALLLLLTAFRLVDHVVFKQKRYGIFNYSHSGWHLISGLIIISILA